MWLFKEKQEIRSVTLTVLPINVTERILPLKHKCMTLLQEPDNFTCKVPQIVLICCFTETHNFYAEREESSQIQVSISSVNYAQVCL